MQFIKLCGKVIAAAKISEELKSNYADVVKKYDHVKTLNTQLQGSAMVELYPSLQELQDRHGRQNNLVVHGIPDRESDVTDTRKMHDTVHFDEICREGFDNDSAIIKTTRFGVGVKNTYMHL